MTPELQERNPFLGIAMLVGVLAVVAGLASRYGVNNLVAIICIAAAVIGTWVMLSPQVEVLESTVPGSSAAETPTSSAGVSAFAGNPERHSRERLRGAPRVAVGFSNDDDASRTVGTPPAHLPAGDESSYIDSVAPVRALGQLPKDAGALQVETTVDPPSNISGAYTLGDFEIRGSSRRGSDHMILNDPRQDDFVVASAGNGRYLIAVVTDGQGTAENAHYGSYWTSRLLARAIDQHLREGVPGIEKMLSRTRDELGELFDLRFTDGTKMRTIATTVAGIIAPVDGGPAAGFRVGAADIQLNGEDGWASIFDTEPAEDVVFPRTIDAEVVPLNFDANCLLIAADGVAGPLASHSKVRESFVEGLANPVSEVEFDQLLTFPLEEARGDRTAVAVWFNDNE